MRVYLFAVLGVSSAAAAEPCIPPSQLVPEIAFPADGDLVPPNGTILLHETAATLDLVGAATGPIGFQTELVEVDDGFGPVFYRRVVPSLGLPVGDTVQLTVDGVLRLTFAVGDTADTEAPLPPSVEFEGPYSNGACVPYASISAESDSADAVAFIGARGSDPTFGDGSQLAGLSVSTSSLVVGGDDAAAATIRVAAIDGAGNVSAASEVDVKFPDTRGCPCVPASPGLLFPFFWTLRRRTRK
ncbi:MAG: hypothetical protein Q8O67_25870 [Deltaproteobacteria bacterium]|nr:hypothetical protein [Deltaproteobacteria bacterium]